MGFIRSLLPDNLGKQKQKAGEIIFICTIYLAKLVNCAVIEGRSTAALF
jgi:hypothetical protein